MGVDTDAHWSDRVSRSIALAHIARQADGSYVGSWGSYVLRSAFQPIFAFTGGRLDLVAFEGLIRPFRRGEAVAPPAFLGIVEQQDRLHVETLCRTLHILNGATFLDPAKRLFLNFDPSVYDDAAVVEAALRDMRLCMHEGGIEPARLVCEVTEQKSSSAANLCVLVQALRAERYGIAVDDYGVDESDMERVSALKPDIVKFDALWTARMMETGSGAALLAVMVEQFAHRGIATVFEGVEEEWQVERAERIGVTMVQGYALARPRLMPDRFTDFDGAPEPGNAEPQSPTTPGRAGGDAMQSRALPANRRFGRRRA